MLFWPYAPLYLMTPTMRSVSSTLFLWLDYLQLFHTPCNTPSLDNRRITWFFPRDARPRCASRGKRCSQDPRGILGTLAEPTGTDGFRVLSHQFIPSSFPRRATCISGFKNVCQRAQAFASQLLPLQRLCHLPSKYLMLFLQATDFRTDILSSQYRSPNYPPPREAVPMENHVMKSVIHSESHTRRRQCVAAVGGSLPAANW